MRFLKSVQELYFTMEGWVKTVLKNCR